MMLKYDMVQLKRRQRTTNTHTIIMTNTVTTDLETTVKIKLK